MRKWAILFVLLAGALPAADQSWPLWDGQESVEHYAARVKLPATQTFDLGNNVKLELVLIPAGQFIMGTSEPKAVDEEGFQRKIVVGQALLAVSAGALLVMLAIVVIRASRQKRRPQMSLGLLLLITLAAGGCVLSGLHWQQWAQENAAARLELTAAKARYDSADRTEKPAHSVTLTKPFYMGKFVVTQEQYQQVTGQNQSQFKGKDNPANMISWEDAQAFCKKVTGQPIQTVRLPTEAEWEYACRAGTRTNFYTGDWDRELARAAWYDANSMRTSHPVGQKESNMFGLYDMHGNVWQWCQDWMEEEYYSNSSTKDPQGPLQGSERALRGGSWYIGPEHCRSARRIRLAPDRREGGVGFRVVMTVMSTSP
jgi:formylglycine-generating enzyme required for sulfatase activity